MLRKIGVARFALTALAIACLSAPAARAQGAAGGSAAPLITQPINEGVLVALRGNTRPEANAANDRGPVADTLPMEHMLLQLRRSAEQEQALEQLIDQLHDSASPNFHQWLTPSEYGARFGLAADDLATITAWLQGNGFQVNTVYPNSTVIDFSGTAGEVRAAFHTEIHNLLVNGISHIANMSDPQIPAALAPAVVGIVSLNDFRPQPQSMRNPDYTIGSGNSPYSVTPADLETIYNINPLFTADISGQGQTIYLIEPTDLYTNNDWTTFRSAFGLSAYTDGSLNTIHPTPPSGTNNCSDPGTNSSDGEAILDAEYASASAPNAAIVMATCASTSTFGGLIAIQNLINNGSYAPTIISMSYGTCETLNGAAANAAFNSAYQQGVAEGVSIFVSAGDQEASGCNRGATATYGIGVNAFASTPYNVAVGGTDFSDTYSGTNSTYWNSTNTSTYGSAKSYTPEIPWNSSCAGQLYATYLGFSTTYGSSGLCNHESGQPLEDWGGSGGPSRCATGSPSITGVVGGTCAGYAKPSWQSGLVGNPSDGVRDLPDVSLFSSFGPWGHAYIICWSDPRYSSVTNCAGAPSTWSTGWGGTSFASPIMAGIQALVNQHTRQKWGNPNPTYYQLAKTEYGASGSSACNSSNGTAVGASCIFYDVTLGDNDAPCTGTYNCYRPSGTYGVLSTSDSSYQPAYKTGVGWDFATGIGTVNAYNLVTNWCFGSGTPQYCNGSPTVGNLYGNAPNFNGDAKRDILWRYTDGTVDDWLMNGGTVTANFDLGLVSPGWTIFGTGDFFGTGTSDILWRCTDSSGVVCPGGTVAIWQISGGQFQASVGVAQVSLYWKIIGTGDFFGTGKSAILWRCTDVTGATCTNGTVVIWEMNGGTIMATPGLGVVPPGWTIAGLGDFNGDGKTDILWRCTDASGAACTEGAVVIWELNGGTILATPGLGVVPLGWTIAGTGNFFGTGTSAILWRCTDATGVVCTDGNTAIWEISNGGFQAYFGLGVVAPGWRIAGTGDFYGTGKSDILWRYGDGTVVIWEMNGSTLVASPGFGAVPNQWILVE